MIIYRYLNICSFIDLVILASRSRLVDFVYQGTAQIKKALDQHRNIVAGFCYILVIYYILVLYNSLKTAVCRGIRPVVPLTWSILPSQLPSTLPSSLTLPL